MKDRNIISITNKQLLNYERNDIEVITFGTYKKTKNKYYVIYDEYDSVISNSKVPTVIKVENSNMITITKGGNNEYQLILEKGNRHYCQYQTEFGVLSVGVYVENIKYDLLENAGSIYMKYSLDMDCNVTMVNEIYINIKENKKN